MTIAEFLTVLGRQAPWQKAAGWDPVGLQIGDPEADSARVAVCHEVTEEVVAEVEKGGYDLLVAYHPLLFHPTARLVAGRSPAGRAYRLTRAGAALAVVHTNYDVAEGGSADRLAEALDLADVSGFGLVDGSDTVKVVTFVPALDADRVAYAMASAGAGIIGNYSHCSYRIDGAGTFLPEAGANPAAGTVGSLNREPEVRIEMVAPATARDRVVGALVAAHPYEEPAFDVYASRSNLGMVGRIGSLSRPTPLADLAGLVGEVLGARAPRFAGHRSTPLERVAVVPGSGSSYIAEAATAGAGALVTGDVSHHRAVEALDRGMGIIDPGHLATERPGVRSLYAAVAAITPGAVDLTHQDLWEDGR